MYNVNRFCLGRDMSQAHSHYKLLASAPEPTCCIITVKWIHRNSTEAVRSDCPRWWLT